MARGTELCECSTVFRPVRGASHSTDPSDRLRNLRHGLSTGAIMTSSSSARATLSGRVTRSFHRLFA